MNILITGASGFLGQHLVRTLRKKHTVIGLGRRAMQFPDNVAYYRCDLTTSTLDMIEKETIDIVFHVAAKADLEGDFETFNKHNVDVTKKLVSYFPEAKFIYISTPSIYANGSNRHHITETTRIDESYMKRSLYAYTKYLGEVYVSTHHKKYIILRPRAILGPYDTTVWPNIMQASFFPLFNKGKVLLSYTDIRDLIGFCEQLCTSSVQNEDFNICSGSISTREALSVVQKYHKKRGIRISYPVVKWLLSHVKVKHIQIEQLELLAYDMVFDTKKATQYGFQVTTTFESCVEEIFKYGRQTKKGVWEWKQLPLLVQAEDLDMPSLNSI